LALRLGGFLGQNVTLESVTTLDGSTWTHAKTFFAELLVFIFGIAICPFMDSSI
jgi:hypothetical protein